MKKFLSAIFVIALILAMATVACAYSQGDILVRDKDDDDDYEEITDGTLAPGDTAYICIGAYDKDTKQKEKPTSISIEELSVYEEDTSDEVKKMITVEKKAEKKKVDGNYYWFAKIKVKSVSLSNYPEDGYYVEDFQLEYDWDYDNGDSFPVNITNICYEESSDELEEDPMLFTFEKDDDVELELPDEGGVFEGVARKDFDIVAAMDTEVNNSLINKYPNADIMFFNGNGANFPVTKGRLTIYADDDYYCYEVDGSKLIDRTNTYSKSEGGFYITTTKLGKYIISDTKLASSSGSASSVGSYIKSRRSSISFFLLSSSDRRT